MAAAFQWLAEPTARLLTLALVHFLWQGLAVACLLVILVRICQVRRAGSRYACSLVALLAMIACPIATLGCLAVRTSRFPPISISRESTSTYISAATSADALSLAVWLEQAQPFLLIAWLAGVVFLSGRLIAGAVGVVRLRRSRQPLPLRLRPLASQLSRRLKFGPAPLVFVSRQVGEAMAVGLIRPLVLIPAAWASEMPLNLLEAVIAHELAHLRRHDLWINLLQRIVESVLFYHPAVWWLSRRLRIERELCVDELAVAATGDRLAYARALEHVACQQAAPVGPLLAAFLRGEKDMQLLNRVQAVLQPANGDSSRLWPAGLVALALPLGLWLATTGWNLASADDERDRERPAVERERRDREVERRKEIRRDAEEPRKEKPRDGEVRKEGPRDEDAFHKLGARDGDMKKPVPRDGGKPKKSVARDADAARPKFKDVEIVERKIAGNDDSPLKVIQRDGDSKGELGIEIPDDDDRRISELTHLVKRLSAQVEKLEDEVSSLRARSATGARDEALLHRRDTDDKRVQGEVFLAEQALRVAQQNLSSAKTLAAKGIITGLQVESAQYNVENAQQQLEAAQTKLEAAKAEGLIKRQQAEAKRQAEEALRKKLEFLEREKERDIPEEELMRLKRKLRDEQQTLLLDRPKVEAKESLKEKPLTRKPLKEKPSEQ